MNRERALKTYRRQPTDRISCAEIYSNPSAMHYITGIDPYEKPRSANIALISRYPLDVWLTPARDAPVPRPKEGVTFTDSEGRKTARWGDGQTWHWDWGHKFKTIEDVLAYDPLENPDFREMEPVGLDLNLSVESLAIQFQESLDNNRKANGDLALCNGGFYNTFFMWPLLTFGWELFSELAMGYPDECEKILDGFAELSRKVFKAWALTDAEVFSSHDDICYQAGPAFSPKWYAKYVYPRYEEYWGYLKSSGKTVVFICDGNIDAVVDDVIACGADGAMSEHYTNWKEYSGKYPDKVQMGCGNNQVISTNDKDKISAMVREMAEMGKDLPGFFFSVGNHLTWDLPPEGVKHYLDACLEYGQR